MNGILVSDFHNLQAVEVYIEEQLELSVTSIRNSDEKPPPLPKRKSKKTIPVPQKVQPRQGDLMKLQNIQGKPELNGKIVNILHEVLDKPGRWQVQVMNETYNSPTNPTKTLSVSVEKLAFLSLERDYNIEPGMILMLQGIKARPEMNGEAVKVLEENCMRWNVLVSSGDEKEILSVTPDKLVTEEEFWKNTWKKKGLKVV